MRFEVDIVVLQKMGVTLKEYLAMGICSRTEDDQGWTTLSYQEIADKLLCTVDDLEQVLNTLESKRYIQQRFGNFRLMKENIRSKLGVKP